MPRPPRLRRRSATLASIAAELRVSRTTVSNAYNRPDQLSPELRQRVFDAARRVGYAGPDPVARSLRTRRAGAVGLLFTETLSYAFRDPAAVAFLEGLALACEVADTGLLLVPAGPNRPDDPKAVTRAGVDGFVIYSMPDRDPHVAEAVRRPVPVVIVDQPVGLDGVDWVGVDDRTACAGIARHLVDLGHRNIGVVCSRLTLERNDGRAGLERQQDAAYALERARLGGLADGFGEGGVDWAAVPVQERFDHTVDAGADAAAVLLAEHPELTAIACTSDVFALGVIAEAERRGLAVPGVLSVIGFDDVPDAERVGLTTVHQPMLDKGTVAGRLVRASGRRARRVALPTSLVVRRSTGPPRGG